MRTPGGLPPALRDSAVFSVHRATEAGVTRGRLEASDLIVRNRGVRQVAGSAPSLAEVARAFADRMPHAQCFSHSTAALLNGVPLPLRIERDPLLHVSVLGRGAVPRVRGVVGHRLDPRRAVVLDLDGIRMTDAATTWCQLASQLELDDLVAAGDFLLTGRAPVGGPRGAATPASLAAAALRHRGSPGSARMRDALPLLRFGSLSRRESLVRVRMLRAGLPEPQLNFRVLECRFEGEHPVVDLAYPEFRVGLEYEGDHHRDPGQFRRDLRRIERLHDAGWIIIRASGDDVPDDADAPLARALLDRIAARLERRGWRRG